MMLNTFFRGLILCMVVIAAGCQGSETSPVETAPPAPAMIAPAVVTPPSPDVQVQQSSNDTGISQPDKTAPPEEPLEDIILEPQDRDPMELVQQITDTSVEVLAELPFHKLNILKNAVYAAKGYRFADDKIWLQKFFCGGFFAEGEYLGEDYTDEENARETIKRKLALQEWRSHLDLPNRFDLSLYAFPDCDENGEITEQQKLAAANIRIATIKKLERFTGNLEDAIDRITIPESGHSYFLLGKLFPSTGYEYYMDGSGYSEYPGYLDAWKMSLKRELMGLNQLVKLMKRLEDFDQMELLGLYAGDIALLKNIIEAKYGKPFQGVPGWEISQLIGVSDVNPGYDQTKLPVDVQVRIQILEETIKKILRSDLSDVPKELQEGTIHINDWYPAAC